MEAHESPVLEQIEQQGYAVLEGVLDLEEDLGPYVDEYATLLDGLARQWHRDGKLSSAFEELPFGKRLIEVARETEAGYFQHFDISLPQSEIRDDTPMHYGPATFNLLRSPRLLDAVETVVGPEIYSNPVQHTRIKPPERFIPERKRNNAGVGRTEWHQDLGVVTDEADESSILTVWVPVTEATEENGCLAVVPGSHKGGLARHCATPATKGIPEDEVGPRQVPLPMKPGDVLFMNKLTMHSSLSNNSDGIRWSLDLRYNPIGEPTGRPWFPGFVARSRANPEMELRDPAIWAQKWREARSKLAVGETPNFKRWDPNDPTCA